MSNIPIYIGLALAAAVVVGVGIWCAINAGAHEMRRQQRAFYVAAIATAALQGIASLPSGEHPKADAISIAGAKRIARDTLAKIERA
jgi:hypothetical protein